MADIAAALDRLEAGQTSLGTKLSAVETGILSVAAGQTELRADFLDELGQTRSDIMGKVVELQGVVTHDDMTVNMGAVDMAR
jgi:hypothetical protein